jgi:hypothetical protein
LYRFQAMAHVLAPTFECRWKLLAAARDRFTVAHSLDALIDVFRPTARAVCSADGATFVLGDGDRCHYVEVSWNHKPTCHGPRLPPSLKLRRAEHGSLAAPKRSGGGRAT